MEKNLINSIKTYLEGLGIPSWSIIYKMKYEQGVLTIYCCDYYRIVIDKNNPSGDGVFTNGKWWATRDFRVVVNVLDGDDIWATKDLRFALNILDNREDILKMIDDNVEFFEADFFDCIAHIKRYGEEEEEVILED